MQDKYIFKNQDLVLKVNKIYDPAKLDLDIWEDFINRLCGDRDYQKEAIKNAIIYLAGGKYNSISDLVIENYSFNKELQSKYTSIEHYISKLQLSSKLFANIDLATGTGKSFIIYGIAQIMLGLGLIDRVLVLCPSLTIESGLKEKFESLSGNSQIKESIPDNAVIKNPRIIDANITIKKGDICVENIHAVYENTGSSIEDSIKANGKNTLILNDESHHIFNKVEGRTTESQNIKKWKSFLINSDYNFKYILGFTGTAYIDNEYFNDVIYRYSLRTAIEEKVVKNIEYVQKDDSSGVSEKLQKIYQNHTDSIDRYPKVKPISILITKDINKAKNLYEDLIDFIQEKESKTREKAEKKILIVTSHNDHKANIIKLKNVDDRTSPVEWIVSVSMLTEGWDVKNVFQIIPWEDRAFNSKLLIAQVLGRGLRIPVGYETPQPKVVVFNHDSWSKNIKTLVDEVLEIETRIISTVLQKEERSKYNFEVYNLSYEKMENEVPCKKTDKIYNFSRIERDGIKLESQIIEAEKETTFESINGKIIRNKNYIIGYNTWFIDDVVDKIYEEFEIRDWEGKILQLGDNQYTQNNLPPRERINDIIIKSMIRVGIKNNQLTEKNFNKILQAFGTLLRKKDKTVITGLKILDPYKIKTLDIQKESLGIGNLRRDSSVFFTNDYKNDITEEQYNILTNLIDDESLLRSSIKEKNEYYFKTPISIVFTNGAPEREFIRCLCKKETIQKIVSWIKSRDRGFYSIEYSLKYGDKNSKTRKYVLKTFNPDFFIKATYNNIDYIFVIEIKADKDDSVENKAKYKYALEHFARLNKKLAELDIKEYYIFHFLSPNAYPQFFQYFQNGTLFEGQEKFRCELENLLEENGG